MEADYAVPKHWQGIHLNPVDNDPKDLDRLKIIGTSYTEPDCPDEWCKSLNTVKWFGPAKEGVVMTTGFKDDTKERDEL
jgi:3'-phosphoadenosine 5'-phosphosulfate sulfotransferase (PAPS reductase)/FAD synthetase